MHDPILSTLSKLRARVQAHTWWAVTVDAQPHTSLAVPVFRNGKVILYPIPYTLSKCRARMQAHTWWAVTVDAQPHTSLVVSVFRNGKVGDPGVQLNAGRTRGAAEYRLPQGQYMVRAGGCSVGSGVGVGAAVGSGPPFCSQHSLVAPCAQTVCAAQRGPPVARHPSSYIWV